MSKKPTGKAQAKSGGKSAPARKPVAAKASPAAKKAAPPAVAAAKTTKPPAAAKPVPKPVKAPAAAAKPATKPPAKASAPAPAVPAKAAAVKPAPARTIAVSKPEQTKKTVEGTKKMAPRPKVSEIVLPPGYRPSESEPFMNPMHRAYFRKRLLEWKDEILRQTRETLAILHEDSTQHADLADRATSETDRATELRTRDRQRKLIAKIDAAVARIEDGSYGYCEETGEPIGLKRLDARPIATLSVEAQERHERREKVYREE
jgi:DnaK suppressor protein